MSTLVTETHSGNGHTPSGVKLPIYMDNHATTPVDPRVLAEMLPFFQETFGNSASRNHPFGWAAEEAVEIARDFRVANRQVSREEPAGSSTTAYSIHFTPRNRCFTPKV